eukprot:CAMPEP_0177657140 /NCGR_PEP_ID=MMETSP0447-20121125/16008_1 /TAXON_ID=0 /ORGANISM="Stygamoeba regulata, Strain BSH-02190019" /LENGTH=796 /DNA_ID=CAMNT_0019161439 /DNA_START=92 /DNA_END=2480 /DNA_ORIENTATION=+
MKPGDRGAFARAQRDMKLLPSRIQGYSRSNPTKGNEFVARYNELNKKLVARANNQQEAPETVATPAPVATAATTPPTAPQVVVTSTQTTSTATQPPQPSGGGEIEEAAMRDAFVQSLDKDLDQLAIIERGMAAGEAGVWARVQSRVRLSESRIASLSSKYPNKHAELVSRLATVSASMRSKATAQRASTPIPSPVGSPKAAPRAVSAAAPVSAPTLSPAAASSASQSQTQPQRTAMLPYRDRSPFEIVSSRLKKYPAEVESVPPTQWQDESVQKKYLDTIDNMRNMLAPVQVNSPSHPDVVEAVAKLAAYTELVHGRVASGKALVAEHAAAVGDYVAEVNDIMKRFPQTSIFSNPFEFDQDDTIENVDRWVQRLKACLIQHPKDAAYLKKLKETVYTVQTGKDRNIAGYIQWFEEGRPMSHLQAALKKAIEKWSRHLEDCKDPKELSAGQFFATQGDQELRRLKTGVVYAQMLETLQKHLPDQTQLGSAGTTVARMEAFLEEFGRLKVKYEAEATAKEAALQAERDALFETYCTGYSAGGKITSSIGVYEFGDLKLRCPEGDVYSCSKPTSGVQIYWKRIEVGGSSFPKVYITQWELGGEKKGAFAFSVYSSDFGKLLTVESDPLRESFEVRSEKVGWKKSSPLKFEPTTIGDRFSSIVAVEVSGVVPDALALFTSLRPCLPGLVEEQKKKAEEEAKRRSNVATVEYTTWMHNTLRIYAVRAALAARPTTVVHVENGADQQRSQPFFATPTPLVPVNPTAASAAHQRTTLHVPTSAILVAGRTALKPVASWGRVLM